MAQAITKVYYKHGLNWFGNLLKVTKDWENVKQGQYTIAKQIILIVYDALLKFFREKFKLEKEYDDTKESWTSAFVEWGTNHTSPSMKFWFLFVYLYGGCFVNHLQSVRTKDWVLRIACIKQALVLFNNTNKKKYVQLCANHLYDLEKLMPQFYKELYVLNFVVPCAVHTGRYLAIDELCEFKNGFLKDKCTSEPSRIEYVSSMYNILHNFEAQWTALFKCETSDHYDFEKNSILNTNSSECK